MKNLLVCTRHVVSCRPFVALGVIGEAFISGPVHADVTISENRMAYQALVLLLWTSIFIGRAK